MNELEEGRALRLDWAKLRAIAEERLDVIPVAVQNAETKEVILVAYVNREALHASLASGTATFWSPSRNELWIKGRTSGDTFELVDVRVNC